MAFSKKTTPPTPLHPLHSNELFKIFFSLLTLSTTFLQKACGPGKNDNNYIQVNECFYIFKSVHDNLGLSFLFKTGENKKLDR